MTRPEPSSDAEPQGIRGRETGDTPGAQASGRLPRLVFLWENFGPMHADRCDAVAAAVRGEAEVVGLELYGRSDTYDLSLIHI